MLIILFGLSGCGKNHIGEILKKEFKFHFWDADEALTEEMKNCIATKEPFTQKMRDDYFKIVIARMRNLMSTHPELVIAQALYKEQNRQQILDVFPQAVFCHVTAEPDIIVRRLRTRGNWVDKDYATQISKNFELPHIAHWTIENNEDKTALIARLRLILQIHDSNTHSDRFFSLKTGEVSAPPFSISARL